MVDIINIEDAMVDTINIELGMIDTINSELKTDHIDSKYADQ